MYLYLKDIDYQGDIKMFYHKGKLHGLTDNEVFEEILDSDIRLLIIPDAGSGDYEQHKMLKEKGIKSLGLDHHIADKYSEDAIVINNQLSQNVTNKALSGCGVTFQFCRYVDSQIGTNEAIKYMGMTAWSIIMDVCKLNTMENRAIVHFGLNNTQNTFMDAMIQEYNKGGILTPKDLSYNIAPKINSMLRQGSQEDMFLAITRPEAIIQWQRIKKEGIKDWNIVEKVLSMCKVAQAQQSKEVKAYVDTLIEQVNPKDKVAICFAEKEGFNRAYTGLIAGKISSQIGKPCIVAIDDGSGVCKGSMRSDISIRKTLNDSKLFIYNSGHNNVFGTSFNIDNLELIKDYCNALNLNEDKVYDVVLSVGYNSLPSDLWHVIGDLSDIYGNGIRCPQFHIQKVDLRDCIVNFVGKTNNTLNLTLPNGIKCVKFFLNQHDKEELSKLGTIEMIVELNINCWNGGEYLQFMIQDYEVVEGEKKKEILTWSDLF